MSLHTSLGSADGEQPLARPSMAQEIVLPIGGSEGVDVGSAPTGEKICSTFLSFALAADTYTG